MYEAGVIYLGEMLAVAEAIRRLLEFFAPLDIEWVHINNAMGRILAKDIISKLDIPLFDNSSVDGFALRAPDVEQANYSDPALLEVVADISAGNVVDVCLNSGEAARIMTGAPLPPGAEAVIPVESTDFTERQPGVPAPKWVRVFAPVRLRENVRLKGEDVRAGEVVLAAGERLRAQDLGFLAMLGESKVPVIRLPRVAIFSTGDELLPVDQPLEPGKIHDSNSYVLVSLIEKYGGQPVDLGIVPDQADHVYACLEEAVAERVDLILSSAGVSVGAFDFVRHIVESHGRLEFWRVNMRPGKPLAFGNYKGIPFIGLPGNPVSAFVGFEVFVRPAIIKMLGATDWARPTHTVQLIEAVESDGRESYLRGIVSYHNGAWLARLTGHQGSGNLRSLVQANALLLVPSGVKSLPIGSKVEAWILE